MTAHPSHRRAIEPDAVVPAVEPESLTASAVASAKTAADAGAHDPHNTAADSADNTAPALANPIADQSATEASAFLFQIPADSFTDGDGDTLSYSATLANGAPLPGWLSFDASSRTFSGTPTSGDTGLVTVMVTAKDPSEETSSDIFNIFITSINHAPTASDATITLNEDATKTFTFADFGFADPDSDGLGYLTLVDLPTNGAVTLGGVALDPATTHVISVADLFGGRLKWTPALNANGNDLATLTFTVTDDDATTPLTSFQHTLTFDVLPVNDRPVMANAISAQSIDEDGTLQFVVPAGSFTDADGDSLTYSATLANGGPLPQWLTFNTATRTFSGTPTNDNIGTLEIRLTVKDPSNTTATTTFSLVVHNTNDAPTAADPVDDQSVSADQTFHFTFSTSTFSDVDAGDELSYSAQLSGGGALPSWLTFDGSTRTFSGTPASDDVGTLTVEIIATDKGGASASEVFDLTINPSDDTNHAPTSITLSGEEVTENAKAGTSIGAIGGVDPDGDTLTFTLLDNAGGRFAIKNGELRVAAGAVIDFETASSFDVEIRATDAGGLTFDQVFTITVNDVPNEPIKGGPKNDTLTGTDGDDTMQGLGGNDTLEGGKGADELDGGTGQDIASYAGAESGVTVNLARPTKNAGDAAGDSYVGIEDIRGSGLADRLTGNNRENVIEGGTGDDILAGGGSSDLFVFGTDNGSDTITDFDGLGADHDVIDLSEAVGIVSMKDLFKNHIKVVGDDLMITDYTGDQIRLLGTDKADIAKADFLL